MRSRYKLCKDRASFAKNHPTKAPAMTSEAWCARTCNLLVATTAATILKKGAAALLSERREAARTAELAWPLGKLDVAG